MILTAPIGYLLGSLPTADWLARIAGINLRSSGTGNPGAANALGQGGRWLGVAVLLADIAKGLAAVLIGWAIAGQGAGLAAGLAAIAGQIYNPWYHFQGGKGLGVSVGATLAAWPLGLTITVPLIALLAKLLGAAWGAILALTAYLLLAIMWAALGLETLWGVPPDDRLVWFAIGLVGLTMPKFISDARSESGTESVGADA